MGPDMRAAARSLPRPAVRPALGHRCACALAAAVLGGAACGDGALPPDADSVRVAGADAERGRQLLERYQCGACHRIPGVAAADGRVGPPLERWGRRSYIAGQFPNGPAPLQQWLRDPPGMLPGTPMPRHGASEADARDMAAYLLSQR
jgi:cytochrome c2